MRLFKKVVEPLVSKLTKPFLISKIQTGEKGFQTNQEKIISQHRMLINMLFARFKVIYTHKFTSAYDSLEEIRLAKKEWAIVLKDFPEPIIAYALEQTKKTRVPTYL